MRLYLNLFFVMFLFCFTLSEAQTVVAVRRSEFKTGKSGFKDAWKHVTVGDKYFTAKGIWYSAAYDEYLKAIIYNNSNAELNYKTGISALFSDKKEEAAGFFLKALEKKSDVTEDILLFTGRALQYSGKYSEAIEKYKGYLNSTAKKSKTNISLATSCIDECNAALIISKDTLRIEIKNIGPNINSTADDFSEVLSKDGKTMFFASRREIPKSSNYYPDSKFDENIFVSKKSEGAWGVAALAGKDITTKYCEVPVFINSANDILYIYTGYENGGDIKMSVSKKGKWGTPEAISYNINSKGAETSFCINPSGNEIYFVSDNAKDSFGGKDIYFIKKMTGRKWSKPQNIGSRINTAYDEESIALSNSGDTLWFSSKGHNSIGGFDVFYSVKNNTGVWDSVKNCGYPINTPWDELFYHPSPDENKAFYLASNRSGGFGGLDIYHGRFLPPEPVVIVAPPVILDTLVLRDTLVVDDQAAPVIPALALVIPIELPEKKGIFLAGKVTDSESGDPVIARIDIVDISTNLVIETSVSSDNDGTYRVKLPAKKSYKVDLHATGFLSDMKRIDIPENWSSDVYNLSIELIKVKVGKKVVLNNILFETGKSVLTKGSYTELDRLFNLMNENPQMKIEISGHTDKTGSEPINFKLSEARAKAVMDYLVNKGVVSSRMSFKGIGSLQPIADNATSQGRAKNRRVEFKILEF
jgi:outer membrane protein OmpA-like peptidoglycan-associated protein